MNKFNQFSLTPLSFGIGFGVSLAAQADQAAPAHHSTAPIAAATESLSLTPVREIDLTRLLLYCPNQFEQSFPTSGPAQTTWRICWHEVAGNQGLTNPNASSSVLSISANLRARRS
jgi:hypothetical protein